MFIPVTIIYASFLMLLMYLSILHLLLLLGLYCVTICSVTAEFQIEMKPHIKSDISKEVLPINTLCAPLSLDTSTFSDILKILICSLYSYITWFFLSLSITVGCIFAAAAAAILQTIYPSLSHILAYFNSALLNDSWCHCQLHIYISFGDTELHFPLIYSRVCLNLSTWSKKQQHIKQPKACTKTCPQP